MDNNKHINPLIFRGQGETFFGIWLVNIFLSIVTLGIYSAWAKVRTKRYFYGNTELAGDVFEYHGKPLQILKGRLVALVCVLAWALLGQFDATVSALMVLAFYLAIPWILRSNARFDAAMTSYRNVHFSFVGTLPMAYRQILGRALCAIVAIAIYFVLVAMTFHLNIPLAVLLGLGGLALMAWMYSWVVAGITRYFINGYRYGDWAFSAELKQAMFGKIYLSAMAYGVLSFIVLTVVMVTFAFSGADFGGLLHGKAPTFGGNQIMSIVVMYVGFIAITLSLTAYTTSHVRNYLFSCMQLSNTQLSGDLQIEQQLTFISKFQVMGFAWLMLSNFLLQIFTLGIARPWVMVRSARYLADHTHIIGDMSLLISNDSSSNTSSAIGDEVAQAFDLNFGLS